MEREGDGRQEGRGEGLNEGGEAWKRCRRLTRQISCECVHCVCFRWPKATIFANFDIWGWLDDEGQIWCAIADPWYTLTCQISS